MTETTIHNITAAAHHIGFLMEDSQILFLTEAADSNKHLPQRYRSYNGVRDNYAVVGRIPITHDTPSWNEHTTYVSSLIHQLQLPEVVLTDDIEYKTTGPAEVAIPVSVKTEIDDPWLMSPMHRAQFNLRHSDGPFVIDLTGEQIVVKDGSDTVIDMRHQYTGQTFGELLQLYIVDAQSR